jgi:hypothetical protein
MAKCGTYSGYASGCRCEHCTNAKRVYQKALRQRNRDLREMWEKVTGEKYTAEGILHGIGGYDDSKCRCELCTAAKAAKDKKRNEAKRAAAKAAAK